ncbi:MAG: pentapeptide repeat-containing protein [Dehalococcoidia bacterium]
MATLASNLYYAQQRFLHVELVREKFSSIEFDACMFERCAFSECSFYRCTFLNCQFKNCDLSLIQVPNARFNSVHFKQSKLVGIDWTKAGTSKADRLLMSVSFDECVLDYGSFLGLHLREMQLVNCSAREVDFSGADLTGATCAGTDFSASTFLHTNLEKADFGGARNYTIDPTANRIKGAKFTLPEALSLLRSFDIRIEF